MLAAPAQAQEQVALQLNWKHQFQFAGYYAAVEKGFYHDAGFSVILLEASEGVDPISEVLAGHAQYGVGASELALRRAQGQPIVVLAVILQHSPLALIARGETAQSIHELAGKRVMLMPHETELYAYLQREGMSRTGIVEVPHSFNAEDLIKGRVAAVSGYSTDEPYELRLAGLRYTVLSPRSSGIDFYGDALFTTEAQVRKDRARVEAFRRASLRGWQYAMQHPTELAELIRARYSERKSAAHLLFEYEELRRLMQPDLVEIGHSNPGRWEHIAAVYSEVGMLQKGRSLEGFAFDPMPDVDFTWLYRSFFAAVLALLSIVGLAWYQWRQLAQIRILKTRLEEQAIRDPLTGLYNRRFLAEAAASRIELAHRNGTPLCIVLIDIDHFKQVNDEYGHEVGDQVLVAFARLLQQRLRRSDIVCRFGGEEFLLLVDPCAADAVQAILHDLLDQFRALAFGVGRDAFTGRTFSAGVAVLAEDADDFEALAKIADQRMYRAKSTGRARVCGRAG